ncbi:MAG: polyphosphate kinase 1 [Clostridiales bacterium]|nr:polyphosphate kinase 1 [Clostridiales bacterium]MDY5348698.1 polyphosphate kinase 1 [Candidatus Ventricola sp.]MDY5514587.1 polyphosphate kinase 1 [Candidatus Ventricola sp.]
MDENTVFMNRELSWLKFNERVLEEAENEKTPFCERLSFASIYQSNLDEFFMVRVGSLIDQQNVDPDMRENKTGMTPGEQLSAILPAVRKLNARKDKVYASLMEQLEMKGVRLVDFRKIGRQESEQLERYFDSQIAPLISPSIVGRRQPFPFLSSREIYAVVVLTRKNGKNKLGIIPCNTNVFPRLIEVSAKDKTYMLAEELILHFIPKVFQGYYVKSKSLLRVTRNADIDADALYDEDIDYREFMVALIKKRKRLAPVRLELSRELDGEIVDTLCEYMDVKREYVFRNNTPLDLSFLFQIQDILRQKPELFYGRRIPQKSPMFDSSRPILAQIREGDKLLTYPYESMKPFLEMLQQAANDDAVVSIKMTLYRVAKQSKVVEALIEAAENGKEVLVLVELKARFDEENNIEWSRRLEAAGCSVIYGLDGYKVHSKLCLITRREDDQTVYYTQIGTGNYNEKTARVYTDLSLMTARPEIGHEAAKVFNALAKDEVVEETEQLLVAPHCLQNKVLDLMDGEIARARAGEPAYIGIKINSLTDKAIIDKLIEASCAGVHIDLIVRGICCLIAGVPGKTENIRVISIVGRFLEHSRIYIFGPRERAKVFIASADYMTRNTLRRVEVAAPILDENIRMRLLDQFETMLRDNVQAREMQPDGSYLRREPGEEAPLSAQETFYQQAYDAVAK